MLANSLAEEDFVVFSLSNKRYFLDSDRHQSDNSGCRRVSLRIKGAKPACTCFHFRSSRSFQR